MAESHVISALRAKRAELSGEVLAVQKRLETLRNDLDAVYRTLRVFDPKQRPDKIRPAVKRKGDKLFAYGQCSRAILNALRKTTEPMSTGQIAERVGLDCRIAPEAHGVAAKLSSLVKGRLIAMRGCAWGRETGALGC